MLSPSLPKILATPLITPLLGLNPMPPMHSNSRPGIQVTYMYLQPVVGIGPTILTGILQGLSLDKMLMASARNGYIYAV